MPIKCTAELWREISLSLLPDCSTEQIYFLLRVSALFIRTASCKRDDFPGEMLSPCCLRACLLSICCVLSLKCQCPGKHHKAAGIALGAILKLSSSVRDWSGHQAAGAESRCGQLFGQAPQGEQPLGHGQCAWVSSSSGEMPSAGPSGCCGGSLGCLVTLPALGLCGGSRPTELLSKVHLIFLKSIRC